MKNIIFLIIAILFASCTYNVRTVEHNHGRHRHKHHHRHHRLHDEKHSCNDTKIKQTTTFIDSQRALANMAKTWTQEERDSFKKDFFYTENDLSCTDSLLNK